MGDIGRTGGEAEPVQKPSSSSVGSHGGDGPVPPGAPSLSAIAVTVRTSGYAPGISSAMSRAKLPAAAVYTMPLDTERLTARWSASVLSV